MINVQPSSENRKEFARWAIEHRIRTVTSNTFGVPESLFEEIPSHLLDGSRVDGQPYTGDVSTQLELEPEPVRTEANVTTIEPPPQDSDDEAVDDEAASDDETNTDDEPPPDDSGTVVPF